MFTGSIDHYGTIKALRRDQSSVTLWVECAFNDLVEGESIAVDGVSLTVVEPRAGGFRADVSPETCRQTIADCYTPGQMVNLERSLRPDDRLSGHFVMGRVDKTCKLSVAQARDDFIEMIFVGLSQYDQNFVFPKGSVTVNGVSLTINELFTNGFKVMLIPYTLETSNLHALSVGDLVNVEFDYIARAVMQQVKLQQGQ